VALDWVATTSQIPPDHTPIAGRHLTQCLGMAPSYAQDTNSTNPGAAATHVGSAQTSRWREKGNPGAAGELPASRSPDAVIIRGDLGRLAHQQAPLAGAQAGCVPIASLTPTSTGMVTSARPATPACGNVMLDRAG
jgi:hypothetical protein